MVVSSIEMERPALFNYTDMCNTVAFMNRLPLYLIQITLGQNHITKLLAIIVVWQPHSKHVPIFC